MASVSALNVVKHRGRNCVARIALSRNTWTDCRRHVLVSRGQILGENGANPCFNGHDDVGASRNPGMMDTVLNLGLNDEIVQVCEDFLFF